MNGLVMLSSNKTLFLAEKKRKHRLSILEERNALSVSDVLKLSRIIRGKLFSLEFFLKAKSILFYVQYKSEVHTEIMIKRSIEMEKTVAVPVTLWKEKLLYLTQVKDLDREIEVSHFGIPEPHYSYFMPIDLKDIDIIVIPGVGFDINGNRLGYGGGFYDRLLKKKEKRTLTLALAYDFQVLEELPSEEHDIPVDFLISEKREISFCNNY